MSMYQPIPQNEFVKAAFRAGFTTEVVLGDDFSERYGVRRLYQTRQHTVWFKTMGDALAYIVAEMRRTDEQRQVG